MDLRPGHLDALLFIAEGVTALTEFEVAAISVVDGDELRIVAVAGSDEAARALVGLRAPVDLFMAELEAAEQWGRLHFVPHDRAPRLLGDFEWISDIEARAGADAWHAEDLLCALLRDEGGRVRGLLSVDLPRNGRRPDDRQRQVLDVYAGQAERAVVSFLERDELAHDLDVSRRFSQYRGRLIDKLAHEVRTPTTSILMHAELALEEPGDAESSDHLEAIVRGAHRINAMAESLLLMAKVDNASTAPAERVDLVAVARGVADEVRDETSRGIEVTFDLPDEPVVVTGDGEELAAAVHNLVSNAVKYSRSGGVVGVAVGVEREQVVLEVRDTGIGIGEEDQARLFEEFFRAGTREVRSRPGHGLGLSIVDRVVRRHGGRIEVDSALDVGTTMTVTLPRAGPRTGTLTGSLTDRGSHP